MAKNTEPAADEPRQVSVTHGPYREQRLTLSPADAEQAIADKWARDAFEPASQDGDQAAEPMTDEETAEVTAKAEKAARKMRGEPEPEGEEQAPDKRPANKAMSADDPAEYETRDHPSSRRRR